MRSVFMYVPVRSLRGVTRAQRASARLNEASAQRRSAPRSSAWPLSEGYIRGRDAGIPALMQLEVKVGLLSQRV